MGLNPLNDVLHDQVGPDQGGLRHFYEREILVGAVVR